VAGLALIAQDVACEPLSTDSAMQRRHLIIAATGAALMAAMPLRAADAVSAAEAKAVRALIEAQLAAFAADDAAKAFSFAAPGIQTMFATPERFLAMVRQSYPVVYRPATVSFLQPERIEGKVIQRVQMADADGAPWTVVYELERQADRSWRIAACVAARTQARST
jgi:hypothetical protein